MKIRNYYFEQDDTDDETNQWVERDFDDFEKDRMGKFPRKRSRRGDDLEVRRSARRAKRDWLRTH